MSMRTLCAQLFIFAVLAAALIGLPQAAQAHAGHAHASHVQAEAQVADVSTPADRTVEQQTEQSLTAAAQKTPGHTNGSPCTDRGCCAQGSCTACFSLVAPMPPLVAPPSLSIAITLTAYSRRSGIDGPSLRRPPKSFA